MRIAPIALAVSLASLAALPDAAAFCGFYVGGADAKLFNNATNVVLMREGTRTVLSMQNNYQGPPSNFAMVVPVPVVLQKDNVKTLPREVFDRIDSLAAPRLVEYWEQDPCPKEMERDDRMPMAAPAPGRAMVSAEGSAAQLGVKIEAQFKVGEYEIVILSANDSLGLDTWLRREGYKIPAGAEPILKPYVAAGLKFFVAKVDVTKVRFEGGQAMLSPLRFHYDTETFNLPVRLGLVNSAGAQDLLVHVLARGTRYEIANYPNTTIPTNLDVAEDARASFGSFYAALFDRTVEKHPRAVVTEYSWDANSCDPCPTPALTANELATLGLDAIPLGPHDRVPVVQMTEQPVTRPGFQQNASRLRYSLQQAFQGCYAKALAEKPDAAGDVEITINVSGTGQVQSVVTKGGEKLGQKTLSCLVERARAATEIVPQDKKPASLILPFKFEQQVSWQRTAGFVLTRLHARYGKDTLGEDLIFRAASPITGGREFMGADGRLEHGAVPGGGQNNFQARYAIRHPWTGPIACANPRRGVWGGPPPGVAAPGGGGVRPALQVAFAPRGKDLGPFLRQDVPEIGFTMPASGAGASPAAVATSAPIANGGKPPSEPPTGGSCGACHVGDGDRPGSLAGLGAAMGAVMLALRRFLVRCWRR